LINFFFEKFTQKKDVITVADYLKVSTFTFVGHSLGGAVGYTLATGKHAPRLEKLVLVTPAPSRGIYDPNNV